MRRRFYLFLTFTYWDLNLPAACSNAQECIVKKVVKNSTTTTSIFTTLYNYEILSRKKSVLMCTMFYQKILEIQKALEINLKICRLNSIYSMQLNKSISNLRAADTIMSRFKPRPWKSIQSVTCLNET